MDSVIDARHVSEPGLVVLDITAADEETAFALMDELQQLWATAGITAIRRDPAHSPASARGCSRTSGSPALDAPCTVASLDAAAGGRFTPPGIQIVSVWVCWSYG
ncbi:DUF6207 family protein [Streptomyces anulatus]|uniref:DUF6207 family protein n=1 Tax=Streptomyces anulatus TaxID=1892 RepID=UPI003426904B